MKTKALFIILMLMATGLKAQQITGDWYGLLDVQGIKLRIVFHIEKHNEVLISTMDSPDQNAAGLPVDETTFTNNEIFFNAKSLGIAYKGIVNRNIDTIQGTFIQGPAELQLILTRNEPVKKMVRRPQDPMDFLYYREDVVFSNAKAGIELAGTLTLPKDKKVKRIVILISGSGPQNRDEEVAAFNHRPFLVWSDYLTRQGIGVLRYDDRGVGQSTGDLSNATTADFSDDAEAALDYLLSRTDLNNVQIGLLGHSEGGMIASMVAARNKNVRFVILLAAPGVPIDQLLIEQMNSAALENVPEDIIKLNIATMKRILAYLKENKDVASSGRESGKDSDDAFINGLKDILTEEINKYPREALEGASVEEVVNQQLSVQAGKWFRFFATYIPSDYLTKVECPVLAINGTLDCQVKWDSNLGGIEEALRKANNKNFEIVPMEGLNHLLQKANTGAISEYVQIEETINPVALKKVSDWISGLQ